MLNQIINLYSEKISKMRRVYHLFALLLLALSASAMFTSSMVRSRALNSPKVDSLTGPTITTSCNMLDLSKKYNYSGLVASGYLTVGKNNSALAFLFYGKKGVTDKNELKNYPTVLWLNGGPGSSSQIGNMQ
jgi:carboxypeptidase C (cathepsin A)